MFNLPHQLEVNISKGATAPQDLSGLGTFVVKHGIQAIVTDPEFIEVLFADRIRLGCIGRYKIICAVDFDRGSNFALTKLRSLPVNALAADGFDILLSSRRPDKEAYNELKSIYEFIRENLDQMKEVRWTLDLQNRPYEDMINYMPYLGKFPATLIRTSGACLQNEVEVSKHIIDVEFVRQYVGAPVKVGGGLTYTALDELSSVAKVAHFDVTVTQARRIFKAMDEKEREAYLANNLVGAQPLGAAKDLGEVKQ